MDVSETFLDGYEEVALKRIDNNGGFIWVNRLPCPNFVFQKEDLEFSSDFNVQKKCKDKTKHENFVILKGKRYAVKNGINAWYRGDIISVRDGKYKVFLVDEGLFTTVLSESIWPLPENLVDIPPLAYRISFFGIKPVCMQLSDDFLNFVKRECENWQPAHVNFISGVLQRAVKIYFKEVKKLKEVIFGIVVVQTEKEVIILNNELCEKGLAEKVVKFEEVSKKLLILAGKETHDLRTSSDEEPSKGIKSKNNNSLSKSEELSIFTKRKSSDSSGSLPITSREYLLKVAFGGKICQSSVDASDNHCSKTLEKSGADVEHLESESDKQQLDNRSDDKVLIYEDDVKQLESESVKLNVSSKSNVSSELSDSASESYDSLSDLNNSKSRLKNVNIMENSDDSLEEHKEKPLPRSKPMSPRVMMLYEKFSKYKKENSISTASESSNYESDDNAKIQSKKRYEKKFYSGALLHQSPSITEEIEPSERLIDSNINEHIHSILAGRQRKDLTQLQMYAYPVLTRLHNLVIVSNPSSGKTLASVVAVLSLLSDEKSYDGLSRGSGPKAIFLTSFAYNIVCIEKMCRTLLSSQKNIVVKSAFGGDAVDKKKCELGEGCDVLITTPRCLLRLLKVRFIINVERLCHLIFDDGDFIFSNFLPEVKELVKLVSVLESKRNPESKYKTVQKIVLSERWFPVLGSFIKDVVKDGFICIPMHNLLEAAVYSNIKPNIQFLKPENKCNMLIDLLKTGRGTLRSVIVAMDKEEALELQDKLDPVCGRLLVAHEGMHHVSVDSIKRAWMENVDGVHAVMICTDDVISDLSVTNADILIHYSLPNSKTLFSSRFVCLLEKYCNIFTKETSPSCKVYIFVDEDNDEQFPEIVSLMERLKFPVSEKIQNVVKRINLQKEVSKKEKKLCENLKKFGNCWKESKCHYRHVILPEVDEIDGFPKTGHVKIKVVYRHDASHLSGLLIEHKVGKVWEKLPSIEKCSIIDFKMANSFDNKDDRFLHYKPKIGDLIAIEGPDGAFYRACIIDLLKFDDKRNPTDVKVKLLESGAERTAKALDLYNLPDELKKEPPQAVDIYLCRLQPTDLDKYWSFSANNLVDRFLLETEKAINNCGETHYLCGRIVLSVGRNLWVDPLTHSEWLESTKTEIYHCSFRHDLIKKNLAVEKSDHLELLQKLCSSSGLNIPKPESLSLRREESVSQGQWAHINRDEFTDVSVIFATNPEKLFLRITKFADRLFELEKDISKLEKVQVLKKGELNVGDLCLALYPDENTWNRAKIVSLKSEEKVEVFYADHGDFGILSWDQLSKIPADLVGKLPFQAIECRLAGVQPINENGWSEESVTLLYKLAETDDGVWKTLSAYVFDLELKAEITGGRKYSVALLDVEQDPVILLNKELVIQGEANWRVEERNWLDDVINKYIAEISNCSMENQMVDEREVAEEQEDWDKIEVNNNTVGLVRSSADTETESDFPSSIIDKQLKELYENDDNVEIVNAKEFICEALNLPIHLMESGIKKNLKALPEPEKKSPVITLLKDENSRSASETESELSFPRTKPAILSLPKCKPSVLTLPKRKVVVSPSIYSNELTNGSISCEKSVSKNKCKIDKSNKRSSSYVSKRRSSVSDSERYSTTSDAADLSELEDCLLKDGPPPLKQVGHCYTPLVYWYQNLEFVWLQIRLIDVKEYSIKWTLRTIIFSTWLNGKYYRLDLSLFGPIYPETLQHSAKGFFVEIKMKKVLAGVNWSRLLQSKSRYNWLKTNPEHVINDSSDDETSKKGKRNCPKRSDYGQSIFGPRPAGLSDSDSSSSDVADFKDLEDDPDDPFNIAAPADSD